MESEISETYTVLGSISICWWIQP